LADLPNVPSALHKRLPVLMVRRMLSLRAFLVSLVVLAVTPAEHAAAIRAVLEQVTAFEVGDPRRFNEAVTAIGYLDELAERATEAEREVTRSESKRHEATLRQRQAEERATELEAELAKVREGRDVDRLILEGFRDKAEARATELERALANGDRLLTECGRRAERAETALRRIATDSENPHTALGHIGYIARAALGETAPRYTMDQGAIIPTDHPPHEFVGRADRWCEVCDLPDRHPVHASGETAP
jgi:hypothetical protein